MCIRDRLWQLRHEDQDGERVDEAGDDRPGHVLHQQIQPQEAGQDLDDAHQDLSLIHISRSFNPGTPWSQWDMYSDKIFVTLDHRFANGWRVKMDASRLKNERKRCV